MRNITTVRISRAKWSRGDTYGENKLLVVNGDPKHNKSFKKGNMCCLGFACLVLGAKKSDISDQSMPDTLPKGVTLLGLRNEYGYNTVFAEKAAEINDDESLSDKKREIKLRKLAKAKGFKFVFVP